jgi:tubulin-folding cofactor B
VGARCEVARGARGVVAYVGDTPAPGLPPGHWVGVRYDEPVGKHDGAVGAVRFFSCPTGYGALVRPTKVTVGDFPELDPFAEEDEM